MPKNFLPFPIVCRWHVIVQTYRTKQEVKDSYYNLSIKEEKYQLDLYKF